MASLRPGPDDAPPGLRRSGDDAVRLTIDYVKQETLGPLRGLGRFVLWGLAGSAAIAIGVLLLLVGALRLLQDETGTALQGDWSWVPYLAVSLIGAAVAGVAAWRITAGPGRASLPAGPESEAEVRRVAAAQARAAVEGSRTPTEGAT
ncbi:MAG TPA: hypothetical protein VL961_11085 [Acidimicrobiales bacterium]|nr:hypothetical protein [Acidimicrobiales bacterium]